MCVRIWTYRLLQLKHARLLTWSFLTCGASCCSAIIHWSILSWLQCSSARPEYRWKARSNWEPTIESRCEHRCKYFSASQKKLRAFSKSSSSIYCLAVRMLAFSNNTICIMFTCILVRKKSNMNVHISAGVRFIQREHIHSPTEKIQGSPEMVIEW